MVKKTGLGKGLDALFSQSVPVVGGTVKKEKAITQEEPKVIDNVKNIETMQESSSVNQLVETITTEQKDENDSVYRMLKINEIEPNTNQPRKEFNEEKMIELANSIKEFGIIQPILVSKKDTYFSIIAGERRWRASKLAGLTEIPAIIREDDNRVNAQISLIENLQREDLNIIEKANGIKALIEDYEFTHNEVAQKLGKARSSITNILRVLNLDDRVLEYAKDGKLSENQCKALLEYEDNDEQYLACLAFVNNKPVKPKTREVEPESELDIQAKILYNQIENQFEMFFGSKVKLTPGKRKGKIIIEYGSNDELERILGLIN